MRNLFTMFICFLLALPSLFGQAAYTDHFDNNDPAYTGGNGFTHGEASSEWTITAATQSGPFDPFTYQPHDRTSGMGVLVDASGNNKVFVRAKASSIGTQLRLDLQDTMNLATTQAGITKTLTTDFQVLEFDFTGGYVDGGFGGTGCTTGPCNVDPTAIQTLMFFANPGSGFTGSIVIDFISFGSPPDTVISSNVFQDHFDDDSVANAFTFVGPGYSLLQQGSAIIISGDGTTGQFDPLNYQFMNRVTKDTFDIDITGNNKLYVKAKSTIANTALRIDIQDIDGFASTAGSITKLVDTAYSIFEYDFTGVLSDLGYGGTPCTQSTAPCPVNGERAGNILIFIEPGTGAFPGQLSIDYISFGVSLEPPGPEADLIYEDHFNNETLEFTTPPAGITTDEVGSELLITGDSTSGQFAAISYLLHDKDSGSQVFLNMTPGDNKVFIKAKVDAGTVPLRIDLVDTANFHTSLAGLTKVITDEYLVYEYNFSGQYNDGGYGGTACTSGPCPVDFTAINQLLIFPDPVQGFFKGEISIDFISIGQALGEDAGPKGIAGYVDQMDDNTNLFITEPGGFTSATVNDVWTLTGDGTAGAYAAYNYTAHNELGENVLIDAMGSNDKLYVRAKASELNTILRVDVQDNQGFVSNLSAVTATLDTAYKVYELDYANSYQDGAFGGSPCTSSPCAVDPERVSNLLFYVNPDLGGYNGTVDIDWISFGSATVGIDKVSPVQQFNMYPNPANKILSLDFELNEVAEVEWRVSNIMGQNLLRGTFENMYPGSHSKKIDIQELPNGIYFVQLKVNGQMAASSRMMKK
ncbi:MAG: T9SS type A sorting domain-containing protein [Bacteroidia bacterium]|nr:T9SS type A sorting domain-containing protein [Bacteroidia bacterium]